MIRDEYCNWRIPDLQHRPKSVVVEKKEVDEDYQYLFQLHKEEMDTVCPMKKFSFDESFENNLMDIQHSHQFLLNLIEHHKMDKHIQVVDK